MGGFENPIVSFGASNSPNSIAFGYESVKYNTELELWFICMRHGTVDRIQTSPDGSTWTVRNPATQRTPYDIAFNPVDGRTVLISATGTTTKGHYTDDGINYTLVNVAANAWNGIDYGGTDTQFFYATNTQASNNKGKSTDNGENFTLINSLTETTGVNNHVFFRNGVWIFNTSTEIFYSTDNAVTFTSRSILCYNFDFGSGVYVFTGSSRNIFISTDLISFTTITIPSAVLATTENITLVRYCDGVWIFGTQTGTFFYSFNLSRFYLIEANSIAGIFRKCDYDPVSKLFIAVSTSDSSGTDKIYKITLI
jgi:hypothetical protein